MFHQISAYMYMLVFVYFCIGLCPCLSPGFSPSPYLITLSLHVYLACLDHSINILILYYYKYYYYYIILYISIYLFMFLIQTVENRSLIERCEQKVLPSNIILSYDFHKTNFLSIQFLSQTCEIIL